MMNLYKVIKKALVGVPPWVILGAVLVLLPVFGLMTAEYLDRQKQNSRRLLLEKGAALIRSFEAGARTGMMRMGWTGSNVQRLLSETARQPDIKYIIVTDKSGKILAHSDQTRIGGTYNPELNIKEVAQSKEPGWRVVNEGKDTVIFEVFRTFSPLSGPGLSFGRGRSRPGRMGQGDWCSVHMEQFMEGGGKAPGSGQAVFVGLDMLPVIKASASDARHTILMAAILLLIGFAGVVSLLLAQAYRSATYSLERFKAFSENLVENMPLGLVATDTAGKIAYFNHSAEQISKSRAFEVLGRNPVDSLPKPLSDVFLLLREKDTTIHKELDCDFKDEKIPLEVLATRLKAREGSYMGCVLLFRDLSDIKNLEEEIARSRRLAAIGRLAAGVAHELRNPLSSIKGFATYFKERYKDSPQDLATAGIMINEVERLNRVISQLLDFARPMEVKKTQADMAGLAEHCLNLVEQDAKTKGIGASIETGEGDLSAYVDQDRIKQVLLNLYLNAIEAMDHGGRLAVRVHTGDMEETVAIDVEDNGKGISEGDLTQIFDPYFTTKPGGTGLGLAIVHRIIEAHLGEIRVRSEPGKGTKISVILPREGSPYEKSEHNIDSG